MGRQAIVASRTDKAIFVRRFARPDSQLANPGKAVFAHRIAGRKRYVPTWFLPISRRSGQGFRGEIHRFHGYIPLFMFGRFCHFWFTQRLTQI